MFIESIESRRLLSAALADDGTLTVTGDASNNVIQVFAHERLGKVLVLEATRTVSPTGRPVISNVSRSMFDLSKVTSVVVNAGEGNDIVSLSSAIPGAINGDAGNDLLRGGRGDDEISGGAGNDIVYGGGGDDDIDGGEGNDYLIGGAGADNLSGGAGDDRILAVDLKSTDSISGGDGDDKAFVDDGDTVADDVETVRKLRRAPQAAGGGTRVAR